jgi:hypothetical protein
MADEDDNDPGGGGRAAAEKNALRRSVVAIEALRDFLGDLDQARDQFDANRWAGINRSLKAVHDYLAALDPQDIRGHRRIFVVLMGSLADLERGTKPPAWLPVPARKAGKPPLPTEEVILRATVAAIVTRTHDAGARRDDAISRAAKTLRGCGIKEAMDITVKGWIKEFVEGEISTGPNRSHVHKHYRDALALLPPKEAGLDAIERIGFQRLREMIFGFRPGSK